MGDLTEMAVRIHRVAVEHGFYEHGLDYPERIACIHEELSELFHAYRKGQLGELCDKGLDLTCEAEEIADAIIRLLDLAAVRGIDIDCAVRLKCEYNVRRPHLHGDAVAPGGRNA